MKWQVAFFFLGIAVLAAAYLPPFDDWADHLFSMHMVQHLLITSVGVPLLLFGAPFLVSTKGLPSGLRRTFLIPILQNSAALVFRQLLSNPFVAVFLYEGMLWGWHLPKLYNLALLHDAIHVLEHGCMALSALNLWRLFIDPRPLRSEVSPPLRLFLLGLLTILDMALSAALTYSTRNWYAYGHMPMPAGWNWTRLEDQQLGGLMMWVPGGGIWILAMAGNFYAWLKRDSSLFSSRTRSVGMPTIS
jgi:putative membrane protein